MANNFKAQKMIFGDYILAASILLSTFLISSSWIYVASKNAQAQEQGIGIVGERTESQLKVDNGGSCDLK